MIIWLFFVSNELLIYNMKPCNLCLNDLLPSADGNKCHTYMSKIYETVRVKWYIFCKIPEVSVTMLSK